MKEKADTNKRIVASLKRASLFTGYSELELRAATRLCTRRAVGRGEVLFRQDLPGDELFVLACGAVKLTRRSHAGREQVIQLVHPGGSLGETVMFCRRRYPVTATAIEPSEVISIPAGEFAAFLRARPKLSWRMMEELSRHIAARIHQIEDLTTQNAPQKVAAFLLARADGRGAKGTTVQIGGPRTEIANLLSIRPETLSRTIREFRQRRWITVERGEIMILDPESLRRVVSVPRTAGAARVSSSARPRVARDSLLVIE